MQRGPWVIESDPWHIAILIKRGMMVGGARREGNMLDPLTFLWLATMSPVCTAHPPEPAQIIDEAGLQKLIDTDVSPEDICIDQRGGQFYIFEAATN
jgi:hypothetical protein